MEAVSVAVALLRPLLPPLLLLSPAVIAATPATLVFEDDGSVDVLPAGTARTGFGGETLPADAVAETFAGGGDIAGGEVAAEEEGDVRAELGKDGTVPLRGGSAGGSLLCLAAVAVFATGAFGLDAAADAAAAAADAAAAAAADAAVVFDSFLLAN